MKIIAGCRLRACSFFVVFKYRMPPPGVLFFLAALSGVVSRMPPPGVLLDFCDVIAQKMLAKKLIGVYQ